jgi:hypothetical protein
MTNHKATFLVQARRSAWPRVFGVMLSCAVAALALDSATAAFARMGENAATTKLELTPEDDTVQQFCKLGDACGDDSALTGNFRGIWRNATFVEPDPKSFPGIRFIGKVLSVVESGNAFDVYCSTERGNEACAKITAGGSGADGLCHGIIDVQHNADCPAEFDYKLEYGKETTTVLKTCQPYVVATCLADDSALVTNGQILAHRALFDYDCRRSCGGACCF